MKELNGWKEKPILSDEYIISFTPHRLVGQGGKSPSRPSLLFQHMPIDPTCPCKTKLDLSPRLPMALGHAKPSVLCLLYRHKADARSLWRISRTPFDTVWRSSCETIPSAMMVFWLSLALNFPPSLRKPYLKSTRFCSCFTPKTQRRRNPPDGRNFLKIGSIYRSISTCARVS